MATILYLVRRPLDSLDHALFTPEGTHEVVLLESAVPQSRKDAGVDVLLCSQQQSPTPLSYHDLVETIFQYDRLIVI